MKKEVVCVIHPIFYERITEARQKDYANIICQRKHPYPFTTF